MCGNMQRVARRHVLACLPSDFVFMTARWPWWLIVLSCAPSAAAVWHCDLVKIMCEGSSVRHTFFQALGLPATVVNFKADVTAVILYVLVLASRSWNICSVGGAMAFFLLRFLQ